jgi:virginiamycin B lyase
VWFTEEFGNRIGRITPAGVITEFSNGISQNAGLVDITAGPDGNLWFTENGLNQIGRITTSGVVTEFSAGITPNSSLGSITSADGFVWFTELASAHIGRISMDGRVVEYSLPAAVPADIAVGAPNGALWITDPNGNGIVRFER